MADAWLLPERSECVHAIRDRITVGGANAEIDLGVEHELTIEHRDGAWHARGEAWLLDEEPLRDGLPVRHGQRLSHSWDQRMRFLIGDRERVLSEDRHLRLVVEPLSGLLLGRRALVAQLRRVTRPTALLMADIDRLRQICDRLGHTAGDLVLRRTAKFLHADVRWPELAYRFGGEEFVILLPDTTIERARQRAERIRVGLEPTFEIDGSIVTATVSIGIAMIGADPKDALREADANLGQAKGEGRNRVVG